MLEFFILLVVLLVMALTGFTLVTMLLVSGLFVLLVLAVCWLISNRSKRSNTYL